MVKRAKHLGLILTSLLCLVATTSCSSKTTTTEVEYVYNEKELVVEVAIHDHTISDKIVSSIQQGEIDPSITYPGYLEFMRETFTNDEYKIYLDSFILAEYGGYGIEYGMEGTGQPNSTLIQEDKDLGPYVYYNDVSDQLQQEGRLMLPYNGCLVPVVESGDSQGVGDIEEIMGDSEFEYTLSSGSGQSVSHLYKSLGDNRTLVIMETMKDGEVVDIGITYDARR